MAPIKRKYRTIYIVTAALMVALIGGYALAVTTVTPGPSQGSNITTTPTTTGWTAGSVSSYQLVILTAGMNGAPAAGNQTTGFAGISGTTYRLAICSAAPCAPQAYRSVNPAAPVVGDYGEQVVLSVTQPLTGGPTAPSGFDFVFSFLISINGGATQTATFQGYLATGSTALAGGATIPVFLFMDFGTQLTMTITSINAVFNTCSSTTACP